MQLKQTAQTLLTDVKHYWKKPPAGRYMPFKEIAAYSVGGIGAYFIITVVQALSLSVGNFIIGNAIGIEPTKIYLLYVIAILSSFPMTALRANIIDSARSKKGKYRPYLLYMGLPTVILAIGFVWMPYEHMSMTFKMITVLLFNIGFQFFYMFFYEAYENLILVLSPNTQERTDAATVKAVIYSLAPSIVNIVMPMAAKFLTNGDMTDLKLYRYAYPPMVILGFLLSIMVYANTQEKIIQAKTHVVQVKFIDAIRAVAKNKYFWIISLAGWIGFLEASYGTILQWLYQYQHACTEGQFALIQTINGNAALWGMLMAPWAIRRFGKKRVLLVTNFLNVIFIASIYPIVVNVDPRMCIWLVLICLFSNGVVGAFAARSQSQHPRRYPRLPAICNRRADRWHVFYRRLDLGRLSRWLQAVFCRRFMRRWALQRKMRLRWVIQMLMTSFITAIFLRIPLRFWSGYPYLAQS